MRVGLVVYMLAAAICGSALADTAVPPKDVLGSDLPWLKRYAGSVILDFSQSAFDEADLVSGPLKPKDGRDPVSNNLLRTPESVTTLQGRRTRFVYLLPAGRSPLEATSGYDQELQARNGQTLYQCREQACGGSLGRAADSGGGEQGLIHHVFPRDQVPKALYSAGWCVLTASNANQRYQLIKADGAHVAVFAAEVKASRDCKNFDGRAIAIVTVVEDRQREQRMELVDARKMAGDIATQGRAVLYGVQFDTDKATIKPESRPQIEQIAAFLKMGSGTFFVVGHTDNQGAHEYNLDLSRRRAAAVTEALIKGHGIQAGRLTGFGVGMLAPVASNAEEPGRSRNRRVEIVPR
ncbi:OOP family OmpA-OmpF porin [Bosea sp. OAE506]|uniref:DUF4892 domain-containing protein n=1 Tax=Bosea sp. OAE506 TaxID=2663870 RepID=UPI001789ECE7